VLLLLLRSSGDANATGSLPVVTITPPSATATGDAHAFGGLFPGTSSAAPSASATGDASASAGIPTVAISAPSATASGAGASIGGWSPPITGRARARPDDRAKPVERVDASATSDLPIVHVFAPTARAEGTRHRDLELLELRAWRETFLSWRRRRAS